MVAIDRLGQVVIHADGQATFSIALHGVGRDGDDGKVAAGLGVPASDRDGGFEAVHNGHLDVHKH